MSGVGRPYRRFVVLIFFWSLCGALAVSGANKKNPFSQDTKTSLPEESLKLYVQRVRAEHAAEEHAQGSIWAPTGQLVRLGTDVKAYRLHDVLSVVVAESLSARPTGA